MADEQKDPITQADSNGAPTPEDLAAIKAQLQEETQAKADLEASLSGKDTRIGELESELSEAKSGSEAKQAELEAKVSELSQFSDNLATAVSKYREALIQAHPDVPQDLIQGDSIETLYASVEKGQGIVGQVKANLETDAAAARIPAGAPANTGPDHGALTPREKIAEGVRASTK